MFNVIVFRLSGALIGLESILATSVRLDRPTPPHDQEQQGRRPTDQQDAVQRLDTAQPIGAKFGWIV
jgi:hypothetical protein